jgi:DNA-binding response OmpR family regulator
LCVWIHAFKPVRRAAQAASPKEPDPIPTSCWWSIPIPQTLDSILKSSGWTCVTAADTLSALCCMVEHAPQAVLIDADSGPLGVWQFSALLRQHPDFRQVRLIISSSRDDIVERARAEAAGAERFLARPFAVDEVLNILSAQRSLS